MRFALRHRLCSRICGALLLLVAAQCGAVEWRSTPAATLAAGSDSNIRLSSIDARRAASSSVSASADVVARDVGFQLHVRPELRALRYANDAEIDRNDVFTTFDLGLDRSLQRWNFGGGYSRESTLTSDFADTAFLGVDTERAQRSLNAGWSRTLDPRASLSVSASATEVAFGDTAVEPLSDYGYRGLRASYRRSATLRDSWQLSVSQSLVDGAGGGPDSTSTAVQAKWSRAFTESLSGEIGIGAFEVDAGAPENDTSASFSFAVAKQGPRWTLSSAGAREVRPEGRGTLAREDAMTFEARRRFGERLSVGAALRGARVTAAGFFADFFERDYAQASVTVDWRVTERVNFYAGVYERSQVSPLTARADGFGSTLSFTYRGK